MNNRHRYVLRQLGSGACGQISQREAAARIVVHSGVLRSWWCNVRLQHWGTTQALRHVEEDRFAILGRHPVLRRDPQALHLSFWSADWTPWRALTAIFDVWPALRFQVQPDYDRR